MTTDPKPTPLEDLAIIWRWVEKNDLDEIRYLRLRAALERLEGYERHPGIIPPKTPMAGGFSLDKFMPSLSPEDAAALGDALDRLAYLEDHPQGIGDGDIRRVIAERDTLRAENAALKAKLDEAEIELDNIYAERKEWQE